MCIITCDKTNTSAVVSFYVFSRFSKLCCNRKQQTNKYNLGNRLNMPHSTKSSTNSVKFTLNRHKSKNKTNKQTNKSTRLIPGGEGLDLTRRTVVVSGGKSWGDRTKRGRSTYGSFQRCNALLTEVRTLLLLLHALKVLLNSFMYSKYYSTPSCPQSTTQLLHVLKVLLNSFMYSKYYSTPSCTQSTTQLLHALKVLTPTCPLSTNSNMSSKY